MACHERDLIKCHSICRCLLRITFKSYECNCIELFVEKLVIANVKLPGSYFNTVVFCGLQ
jgi:hypothetical protein